MTIKLRYISLYYLLVLFACAKPSQRTNSEEQITDKELQLQIFENLTKLTHNSLPDNALADSSAFLILPVQASCPGCRNKTIDSIVAHRADLLKNRFVIISANGGRKTIKGYFKENGKELPVIENKLFLDTANLAYSLGLYDKKPTIYYGYKGRVYKKVAAVPATVRDDLKQFFSGETGGK